MCLQSAIVQHTMTTHEIPRFDDEPQGEVITPDIIDLRPVLPRTVTDIYAGRPPLRPVEAMGTFVEAVGLHERHGHMKIVDDLIGLRRDIGGKLEHYRDKLLRAERGGKQESARFGIGTILGERAVIHALDWDYFAGSLGEVAGEKFVQAAELAEREKLPFVSIGASSGVRQHENVLGLVQMQRMAAAASKFMHVSDQPYISVLAGQVWGGMSASAVPVADLVVALEGTDYGFAGPRVIETFEGRPVPVGAQSAEANLLDRNIDVLVKDIPELLEFLGRALHAVRVSHANTRIPDLARSRSIIPTGRQLTFGDEGFYPALWDRQHAASSVQVARNRADQPDQPVRDQLLARYNEIISGAGRLDSEFIMQSVFDSATPLYNAVQFENQKKYPNIIASVATIADQAFMVIGDQPSYVKHSDTYIAKRAANPGPEDFEYAVRMMEAAERWKLPIVFLTDTLGALPTMAAERRGQSRAIANAIRTASAYPYPTISVITGALGSGGGLATTPFGRETIMLDSALAFVSEPRSMASILYNVANPTVEQIGMTLETVKASASDLRTQGLVDTIITDTENPHDTAAALRSAIIDAHKRQQGLSGRSLRAQAAGRLTPKMINKRSSEFKAE